MEKDKLENKKIAIIGFGHIGKAFYKGLINSGFKKENILTSNSSGTNKRVAANADWIVIALKPSVVANVLEEIKNIVSGKIILSFTCGVTISSMQKYVGSSDQKVIRLMPNIPIAEKSGVIGIYADKNVSSQEKSEVIELFSKLGKVIHCKKEEGLDAMTILSGSGPAIVSYFISMLSRSGEKFGLEKNTAAEIALHTFSGTISYLQKTKQTPLQLQNAVATKGGTTEEIIRGFNEENIYLSFAKSLDKGYEKVKQINHIS